MSSIVVKVSLADGTVRRRKFDAASVTLAQVKQVANIQDSGKLTWTDEENDVIVIEVESDLQEAIRSAQAQQIPLRLAVSSTVVRPSVHGPRVNTPPFLHVLFAWLRHQQNRAIHKLQSAARSPGLQAVIEDARSIRAIFEARVDQNPFIIPTVGLIVRIALVFAFFYPTSMLSTIGLGLLLFPRNALSQCAYKHTRILLGLVSLRVVLWLCGAFVACATKVAFGLLGFGVLFYCFVYGIYKCAERAKRRRLSRYQYRQQRKRAQQLNRARHEFNNQSASSVSPAQIKMALKTLRKIFPNTDIQDLRRAFIRHGNVQQTVLELTDAL